MIRVSDLPRNSAGTFLYCTKCGARSSAAPGDYFATPPTAVFRCCGKAMILARAHEVIERVGPTMNESVERC